MIERVITIDIPLQKLKLTSSHVALSKIINGLFLTREYKICVYITT